MPANIQSQILKLKNKNSSQKLTRFFQTNKGNYGEGDLFLGIKTPPLRKIVKTHYKEINLKEIQPLLINKYHEIRLVAYLILVEKYQKTKNWPEKNKIVAFYLNNLSGCNNWDLVDLTCYKILGDFLISNPNKTNILYNLYQYQNLWTKRIAIVTNMSLVKKNNNFSVIKKLAEDLINNGPIHSKIKNKNKNLKILNLNNLPAQHTQEFIINNQHLLFKACGWILREVGKSREGELVKFLQKNYQKMPGVMFSYAKEKLSNKIIATIKKEA